MEFIGSPADGSCCSTTRTCRTSSLVVVIFPGCLLKWLQETNLILLISVYWSNESLSFSNQFRHFISLNVKTCCCCCCGVEDEDEWIQNPSSGIFMDLEKVPDGKWTIIITAAGNTFFTLNCWWNEWISRWKQIQSAVSAPGFVSHLFTCPCGDVLQVSSVEVQGGVWSSE